MLGRLGSQDQNPFLLMDRAYEGNETRQLALTLGFTPVVPPRSTRVDPWQLATERNRAVVSQVEGLSGFVDTLGSCLHLSSMRCVSVNTA